MQVKEVKHDGLAYEFEITIPSNDIDVLVEDRLQEVGKTVKIPGFRPGKVPMAIMKQKYGKAVLGEVLETAVNKTSEEALASKKLRPALQPKIEVKSFDEGKDLVYSMSVEIVPEFKVMDFKGVKVEKPVAKPDDAAIDDALNRIAEQRRSTKAVETKRAAKNGDVLIFDFDGRTADDNVKQPGMQANDHRLELGSGQFIPGFEEQLVGHKVGEEFEVTVSFPENYGAAELAGRDAIFEIKVNDLHEYTDAKLDDEFAKSLGMDDLKALRVAIGEQIAKEYDGQSRLRVKKALLDIIDDGHKFDVPESMVELEYKSIIQQVEQDNQQSGDVGDDAKLSDEDQAELKVIAERRVKLGLVLAEIGNSNKINVADAELQKAVIMEAQKYPGQEKEVFDFYSKNPQALEGLRAPAFEDKVIDFILELADVSEKSVSIEELTAEEEAPKKKPAAKKSTAKKAAAKSSAASKKKPAAKKKAPAKKKAS